MPPFRREALAASSNDNNKAAAGSITAGQRNKALHRHLLRAARHVGSFDDLLAEARRSNEQMLSPPLPDAEVVKTADSVCKYQKENGNWVGSQGRVHWSVEQVLKCAPPKHSGDALILMTVLRAKHATREEPFAVAPRAMAEHHIIPGWGEYRIREALAVALKLGLMERVHKGGRRPGDPSCYRLRPCV